MSYERLPYADAETPRAMSTDCLEAGTNLHLPGQRAVETTGGDLFDEAVAGHPTFASSVAVPDSLALLAGEMALHFD
jgi:hypothetical protein